MFSKSLVLLALFAASGFAETHDHLDLEVEVEGRRELFPLLPGVKCPKGHVCHSRSVGVATDKKMLPLVTNMRANQRDSALAMSLNWEKINDNLLETMSGDSYCNRRNAMKRAAGLASGVALMTVNSAAYAGESKSVQMGSDSGQLVFVPAKISICKGDTVVWTNNKGGPHNVVFDEDGIPGGVSQEKISMDSQLGDEGDTFKMTFDTAGNYDYYCEPHRGAGMNAVLIVA